MYIKKSVLALILIAALLIGAAAVIVVGYTGNRSITAVSNEEREKLEYYESTYHKFEEIRKLVEEEYYVKVDPAKLMESAYSGYVAGLGDPYSEYITAEDFEDYYNSMMGEYSGVGMSFYNNDDGVLEVVQVYRNSPAKAAGMQPGDIITEVDGTPYAGSQSSEAAAHIRGQEGTDVTITYIRDGKKGTVTITRAKIQVETVAYTMLEDKIGYIQIDSFEAATAEDFSAALEDLTKQGAKGLVIDLRNNGGGLVNAAVSIADMLMNKATVVYTEDQNKNKAYYTTEDGRTALPYVLLVNEYTASASEILAAGIQDNGEGKIVGTVTYGKGIIQQLNPLYDDSAVKITIRQYFTPSGKTIHKVGIIPDYEVELIEGDDTDYQLLKALEVLK